MVSFTLPRLSRKHKRGLSSPEPCEKPPCRQQKIAVDVSDVKEPENYYTADIETIRRREFPLLKDMTYLDHGGTTLYAKSLIESFAYEMTSEVFGNPHSASPSSQLCTQRVDDARLRLLQFFNADPDQFDIVFVANATAAIKLVIEAVRDYDERGFWYGYHTNAHTSLTGPRNVAAQGSRCFAGNDEVQQWIDGLDVSVDSDGKTPCPRIFAYPAQSNMTGARLGLDWCRSIRQKTGGQGNVFTLYDAAAYVSTAPLDLSDSASAPDFTALSLYKVFGFPDLGVLIVRKSAGHIFEKRRYFGGGTVGMVISLGDEWHAKKASTIHDTVEDGTLPFHNIIAVHAALDVHKRLYGSMQNVSYHTAHLAKSLYSRLTSMRHFNGAKVCEVYKASQSTYGDPVTQGPVIAFNMKNSRGVWVGKSEVEKLAAVKGIHIRSGGLCNPGGIASFLQLSPDHLKKSYALGMRCGDEMDVIDGRPTGVVRVSLGAMSSMRDIDTFVNFVSDFYVEKAPPASMFRIPEALNDSPSDFYIDRLCVYPIKSCGAFSVPADTPWEIRPEGLAWDREWCLVHQGTNAALSQKKYPKMALIRPVVDLKNDILRITCGNVGSADQKSLELPLSRPTSGVRSIELSQSSKSATVCGDTVIVHAYTSPKITAFFSDFLGTPCMLSRTPPQYSGRHYTPRSSKRRSLLLPDAISKFKFPSFQNPILLSNESPMLLISRSSVNKLNEQIKHRKSASKTVPCDVFRANIIIAEDLPFGQKPSRPTALTEHPYLEDYWSGFQVGTQRFDVLSSCQRCQMVCIDQNTGARSEEPYATLAKTRKVDGKPYFGRHVSMSHVSTDGPCPTVKVGDRILPFYGRVSSSF
ncbi:hypothetical protein LOZ58_003388 [Ophidiomyces ophidiicola]|nr:hypothetical protein LOZ65_000794 [Ophidiomyces ophidiicola]KAI1940599.1 hypothetical protein LOZ66_002195 [Ophidiomyces ophidiicola]KAI1961532.1 hypothetical protein LOZ58_003388 [Ophidiomyces ophidiicola]